MPVCVPKSAPLCTPAHPCAAAGPKGIQKMWCRWTPPAREARGPPARPAARSPAAAGACSPPARPAPAAGPLSATPPGPLPSGEAGAWGGRSTGARAEGGFEPRLTCSYARVYPHTPIYARMWACAPVRAPTHPCTYATHGLPGRTPRQYLLRHSVPPYMQHTCCRRLYIDSMSPFLTRRKRDVSAEK